MHKDNKIDNVVDEILESTRVKQASIGFLKIIKILVILSIPIFILIAIGGRGR